MSEVKAKEAKTVKATAAKVAAPSKTAVTKTVTKTTVTKTVTKVVSAKTAKPEVEIKETKVTTAVKPKAVAAKPVAEKKVATVAKVATPKVAKTAEKKTEAKPVVKKETTAAKPVAKKETAVVAKPVAKKEEAKTVVKEKKVAPVGKKCRLASHYQKNIVPHLTKQFGYKNANQVPKLVKIVLNMGLGDAKDNTKSFQMAVEELGLITGQKPLVTKAKKSIANFKLRENQNIGAKVTLRGERMYLFLDKLISVALPRVRDFRGISPKSFDKFGNYSFGIKEQIVFPEISYEKIEKVRGFDICIVTTANTSEEAYSLLKEMGLPFRAK